MSSSPTGRVYVLDDEANMGKVLTKLLRLEGFEVLSFEVPKAAVEAVRAQPPDVLLSDLRMPEMSGEQVLEQVKQVAPACEIIIMTGYGTVESAMRCVRNGAYDYVTKPFDTKALLATVRKAVEKKQSVKPPVVGHETQAPGEQELLGDSPEIKSVRSLIRRIAPTDSAVIIYGESGTGKELAARAIHRQSTRAKKRFLAINCASIPENLIESELFGHEKGSFTGAIEAKKGLLEVAHEGTLFLDEIGELPLGLQAKLLRALQEREITRVGSAENIPVDIRVVAATNRKLEAAVAAGEFRQDLYYRLHVLSIKMPPLRERASDIRLLAEYFLQQFRTSVGKPELGWSGEVVERLAAMPWPGNVRQLRNFVERLVVLAEGTEITPRQVTEAEGFDQEDGSSAGARMATPQSAVDIRDFREARDEFEADYLRKVLRACEGNVSEAAKRAGMSRRNFYEKIEKLGISMDEFKG